MVVNSLGITMTSRRRPRSIGTGERSETASAGRSGMPSVRQTPSSVRRSLGNWLAESVEHACMDRRNRRRFRCDHDIRQARMRIPTAHSPPTKFNDRSIQVCLFPIRAVCPMLKGARSVRARATRREPGFGSLFEVNSSGKASDWSLRASDGPLLVATVVGSAGDLDSGLTTADCSR